MNEESLPLPLGNGREVYLEEEDGKGIKGSPFSWLVLMPRLNSKAFRNHTSKDKRLINALKNQYWWLRKRQISLSLSLMGGEILGNSVPLIRSLWPHP